jgi:putative inorganic carbon (HCO3(-)) transporter
MSILLKWLLAAYIFFLPMQLNFGPGRTAPSDFFILAYAVVGIGHIRTVGKAWSGWHFAIMSIFVIGMFQAANRDGVLTPYVLVNKSIGLAVLFVSYWVLTSAADSFENIRWMLRIFVIAVSIHAAASAGAVLMFEAFGSKPLYSLTYLGTRASGMLIDPNAFGGLVVVGLAIHATTFFGGCPLLKGWMGYLSLSVLAAALILTLSRSAWIGMGAAIVLGTLMRPKLVAVYAGVGVAVMGLLVVLVGSGGVDTFSRIANRPNTTQQRLDQINEALPMIAEHPLFGSGIGAFVEKNGWIIHNSTVWILTEFGLVGLTVYLGYLLWFYIKGFGAVRLVAPHTKSLIVGLLSAHLGMQAVSVGIEAFYQRHWWFTMAMLASSYAIATARFGRPLHLRSMMLRPTHYGQQLPNLGGNL